MLGAGKLNKRVTIQRQAATQDAAGEVVPGWALLLAVWANVKTLSGGELVNARATEERAKVVVTIRNTDITPNDRVLYGTRTLEDLSVIDKYEEGIDLLLTCAEVN